MRAAPPTATCKRMLYGNRKPLLDAQGQRPRFLSDLRPTARSDTSADWMFEVRLRLRRARLDGRRPDEASRRSAGS